MRFEIGQAGELREVDDRGVRQPADHFAREVALDLLGPELAHELLQPLAGRGAGRRAHADRREHEAVPVGDDDVQANVAGDESLELLADGADQWRVGTERVGAGERRRLGEQAGARSRFASGRVESGVAARGRVARRQVGPAGGGAEALHALEHPRFDGHVDSFIGRSASIGHDERGEGTGRAQVAHVREGGQAVVARDAQDEATPGRLQCIATAHAQQQCRQRQVDLHGDAGDVADQDEGASQGILEIAEASVERAVEGPDQRRGQDLGRCLLAPA